MEANKAKHEGLNSIDLALKQFNSYGITDEVFWKLLYGIMKHLLLNKFNVSRENISGVSYEQIRK